jgi:hypothetical protein
MPDPTPSWPQTVEAAVVRIMTELTDASKADIANLPESQLCLLHFGLGMYIRNTFGLWQGNQALLDSCSKAGGGFVHPDDANTVIIKALWQRLRA